MSRRVSAFTRGGRGFNRGGRGRGRSPEGRGHSGRFNGGRGGRGGNNNNGKRTEDGLYLPPEVTNLMTAQQRAVYFKAREAERNKGGYQQNKDNGNTVKNEKGNGPEILVDEDAFHTLQSTYTQAEHDSLEEAVQSVADLCWTSLQLVTLCMIVAKLDKNYKNDDLDDVGFNTIWILFPYLLCFGFYCYFNLCWLRGTGRKAPKEENDDKNETRPMPGSDFNYRQHPDMVCIRRRKVKF